MRLHWRLSFRTELSLALLPFCTILTGCPPVLASSELPLAPTPDSVMATTEESAGLQDWVAASFRGGLSTDSRLIALKVRRQDHNTLHFNESCLETPLQIGTTKFVRGLGTHANSEIEVAIPQDATAFKASVGVDNNYDTGGARGSVRFSAAVDGKVMFKTETLRAGQSPVPVDIPLFGKPGTLTLVADTTEDGPAFDQADWAEAKFVFRNGQERWLDEGRRAEFLRHYGPPFSFNCGGHPSSEFIKEWKRTESNVGAESVMTWEDPWSGLAVSARYIAHLPYGAVEWMLEFQNQGTQDTPVLEDIRVADMELDTGNTKRPVTIRRLRGDSCSEASFSLAEENLECEQNLIITPQRGRPSQETAFPFWNLVYRDGGVITAIGWSGQWSAIYDRLPSGVTRFRAGMEKTRLVLHPGEAIRSPRILLMPWKGDLRAAHNRFRRLMLFEQMPKHEGRPLGLPVALQTFDRYCSRPGWATEAGQLQGVEAAHCMGFDTYWFDAGWFPGGFPNGVGNWSYKPVEFPNGLKPVGDLCKRYGIQFLVWFEPCRVAPDTQIAREHPEFVLGGAKGGLFNLGDPKARKWITDRISTRIAESGINVYREDFNIDPLSFWRNNDETNRQGMTEIRFVEGHYAFWDELRSRHPGLWIDNCASGGRRIDLETCKRSVPLWRSDTSCSPGHPEWNQQQAMALSDYLPLHTAAAWELDRYTFRSVGTGGILCEMDYLNPSFSFEKAKLLLAEAKAHRKYWYGDFYPITSPGIARDQFATFQLHRPDLNAGLVLAFRRPACNLKGISAELQGLDAKRAYTLVETDEAGHRKTLRKTGAELRDNGLDLRITSPGQSLAIEYTAASP